MAPVVKDVYEVLRQKEIDCTRLQKEIDALRVAILLLSEDSEQSTEGSEKSEEESTVPVSLEGSGSSFWRRWRQHEG